jgi:hypothetical protein
MIDRHWDWIAAYCHPENKAALGFVEGLNNKIRVLQRRAYGLRDEEYDPITFQPKWQIALGQIQAVQAKGVPRAPVPADAGYGDTTAFRDAFTTAGLAYVVGVKNATTAWPPGEVPRPPKCWKGDGRPPTKDWLSTLPATTPLADLVRLAKLHRRIERDYQELHRELGLDHFERRGWHGFHHHGALCIAASAYLAAERARLSPLRLCPSSAPLPFPKVSRREARPVRPERHVPTSIATTYELLARALLQRLPCRSCDRPPESG